MANNKALFLKWIKNLFYIHCVALVGYVIGLLPFIGSSFGWINSIIAIGTVFCLYKLMPVQERYRKAAIFSGIAVALSLITNAADLGLFSIVISICQLIGLYQEFCGHSEVLLVVDGKLSRQWHTLFNWNVFGSIIVGILGAPVLIVAALSFVLDTNMISVLTALLIGSFDLIIRIFYLVFLKRTYNACEKYEHWIDDVVTGDEI